MCARRLNLSPAGAPELVRGNQKDRFYLNHVTNLISDISQQLLPLRYLLRWERELHLVAEVTHHTDCMYGCIDVHYIICCYRCYTMD